MQQEKDPNCPWIISGYTAQGSVIEDLVGIEFKSQEEAEKYLNEFMKDTYASS